jgi:glucuronosyltransferase
MTAEMLRAALDKILNDARYTKKAKLVSRRFRDQPERPIDRAAWWVEWVLRNPDADHLKSPTLALGTFRSNLYDIQLFVVLLLVISVFFARKFIKKVTAVKASSSKKRQ